MGFGSFLKKAVKGIGKVAKVAAPVLAMTGVGAPLAAGIGALGGVMSGGGLKGAATGALGGLGGAGAKAGLGKLGVALPQLFGGGAGAGAADASGASGGGGVGGFLGKLVGGAGDLVKGLGNAGSTGGNPLLQGLLKLGGLGAAGYDIYSRNKQRSAADQSNQQRYDIFSELLKKGEAAYDEKKPLRDAGQQAILSGIAAGPGPFADYMNERKSGKRAAGQYAA